MIKGVPASWSVASSCVAANTGSSARNERLSSYPVAGQLHEAACVGELRKYLRVVGDLRGAIARAVGEVLSRWIAILAWVRVSSI